MKKYSYIEPGDNNEPIEYVYTEDEILWEYWSYWSSGMERIGKGDQISTQNCIDDWIVLHWAKEC